MQWGYPTPVLLIPPNLIPIFIPLLVWSLIWKGFALYKAARKEHKVWFVVLLVVNTIGILEILYLQFFSKAPSPEKKK